MTREHRTVLCRVAAVLLLAGAALTRPAAPAAAATLTPVADATVDAGHPLRNYGGAVSLRVDGSPHQVAYLRFEVTGTGDEPSAVLRLYIETASSTGLYVHGVSDDDWREGTLTYHNAPPIGPVVASSGPIAADTWLSVDVSSLITGDRPVTLALTTTDDTGFRLTSRDGTESRRPQLIVPAPPNPSPYTISRVGAVTYSAVSEVTGQTWTGSLKTVVESAAADVNRLGGGTIAFTAGTFDLGAEFFKLEGLRNVTFVGAGMGLTLIRNSSSAAADTEPFNTKGMDGGVVRDLTVSAGGPPRTTSDALDFDDGNNMLVERVRVTASRGRGIIFDGKNQSWTSMGNTVRDCQISGTASDGIELLATSGDTITGCVITGVGGHGVQINRSSPTADQPNKTADDNVVSGNRIDQAGQDGINIDGGNDNHIVDNHVTSSSDDVSGRDGIRITTATSVPCSDNFVSGNVATDTQAVKTQRYGLNITTPGCVATVVGPGNNLTGNLSGAIRDAGTGTIYR
ncbi:right-handed parallel beta-helix repeat-containing protein [Micromonospora sp. KC207]|uniref:CBM96 family carbohydrate-binding protein n=1 Tax=Micromonospora sp. KC207 TaxID=2530377 RepID=UPI00104E6C7D|nr:right-handed parallel beta-helix repeat-containing protein [Micromonospora sp. KC207]TDC60121.1 right-handed parallel beta-helix repeat-containing protein [Micromonospora sp. KC207]